MVREYERDDQAIGVGRTTDNDYLEFRKEKQAMYGQVDTANTIRPPSRPIPQTLVATHENLTACHNLLSTVEAVLFGAKPETDNGAAGKPIGFNGMADNADAVACSADNLGDRLRNILGRLQG